MGGTSGGRGYNRVGCGWSWWGSHQSPAEPTACSHGCAMICCNPYLKGCAHDPHRLLQRSQHAPHHRQTRFP